MSPTRAARGSGVGDGWNGVGDSVGPAGVTSWAVGAGGVAGGGSLRLQALKSRSHIPSQKIMLFEGNLRDITQ
jgi:hypothetical protein